MLSILSTAVDMERDMVGCFLGSTPIWSPPEEWKRRPPARAINVAPSDESGRLTFESTLIRGPVSGGIVSATSAATAASNCRRSGNWGLRQAEPTLPDQESTGGKALAPG